MCSVLLPWDRSDFVTVELRVFYRLKIQDGSFACDPLSQSVLPFFPTIRKLLASPLQLDSRPKLYAFFVGESPPLAGTWAEKARIRD